jgi:ABC-type glycerol-3-phosphate transport system substrate-binding protein
MLIQRHLNPIDAGGTIHLNDPRVAQTLAFYASMVAGPSCIAGEAPADTGLEYKDLTDGNLCAMLCPDWRAASLARHVPQLAGAWRLIPLPRFDPTDAPTASYGGTFIAIPRQTANPEAAWKVIEHLYFSPEALAEQRKLGVLPALPEAWNDSDYDQADAYFGGQKPMRIYADLAWQTPPVEITPSTLIALGTLSYVQSMAVAYASEHGTAGLEAKCQAWLDAAAVDLRRRIEHSRF